MKTIFAMLALAVAGSAVAAPAAPAATPAEMNAAHQSGNQAAGVAMPNKGKAVDVIGTAMYTYVQVQNGKDTTWIAASSQGFKVKKGDTVSYSSGPVMEKFHSKTLNRDFATIMFVDSAKVTK